MSSFSWNTLPSDFPEMIPPVDYPLPDGSHKKRLSRVPLKGISNTITVESQEFFLLARFAYYFGEYVNDRWNPGTSRRVLNAYKKIALFYNGKTAR